MRFLLPLVTLCALSSVPLRASNIYDITLTGTTLSGSGTFTTDGICDQITPVSAGICGLGTGLLSLTVNIGSDTGAAAFDIMDDSPSAQYVHFGNDLSYQGDNSETGHHLGMGNNDWSLVVENGMVVSGTFSVTPEPEPRSLFLLLPIVAIVGLRWRHQRHRT